MEEIEVEHGAIHGHAHPADVPARRVGLMVGTIGVLLAVATIGAHREHTAAVIHRTEANDAWAYYQAKKIRENTTEVGQQLLRALGTDAQRVDGALSKLDEARQHYKDDAEKIKQDAEAKDHATERSEHIALRLDLGEGFLELGLVMTSLFFLGRQRAFPLVGGVAATLGALIAASSWWL